MAFQPIENGIFFEFVEDSSSGKFINQAASGILLNLNSTTQANIARWGKPVRLGPDVADITLDDYILVESAKWTTGFKLENGRQTWKTDQEAILAVSDVPHVTY
jgi:hypothetical protein